MHGVRLLKILKAIDLMARPGGAGIQEIARELETDRRSVYRLRDTMESMFFPIYEDRDELAGIMRWKIQDEYLRKLPNITIPDMRLTFSEILALYLLKGATSTIFQGSELNIELERAFHKIGQLVPEHMLQQIKKIQALFHSGSKMGKDYSGKKDIIDSLTQAMLEQRICLAHYFAFHDEQTRNFRIQPLCFFENKGGLYIFVHVPRYDSIRTLAVERIVQLELTNEYFAFPQDFDPDTLLGSSFDIVFDDPLQVSIWIAKGQAKYVLERTYFQDQQVQYQEDGSIIITIQTSGWEDVKRWVLGFGPQAVVLEPQELREEILRDLSSCLSLYTNKSGGMGQKSR